MRKQPLDFRKEDVQAVMRRWQASESCSLIGVGSVGKSNLLQHISDPDVHQHYLTDAAKLKAIIIDPNLLVPISSDASDAFRCWAGYELMMHRLYMAFYPFEDLGDDATHFFDAYQALQDGTNPLHAHMGLRYFELGLEFFLRRDFQIIFMFDEFEELLRQMPAKFFQTLRGLRDNHKKSLSYLAFSREPIPHLSEKMGFTKLDIEPFAELFTDNTFYVGPYNTTDANAMIDRLVERNPQYSYSSEAIDFLLYASGRYAGIIRAGFRSLEWFKDVSATELDNEHLIARFAARRPVQAECETIWDSLSGTEQRILTAVVRKRAEAINADDEVAVSLLVQKRLVKVDREHQSLIIQPPVLRAYINTLLEQQ